VREAPTGIAACRGPGHAGGLTTARTIACYIRKLGCVGSDRDSAQPILNSIHRGGLSLHLVRHGRRAPLPRHLQILCFERRVLIARGHVFALRGPGAVALRLRCHRKSAPL
jgi:hypothetical protein